MRACMEREREEGGGRGELKTQQLKNRFYFVCSLHSAFSFSALHSAFSLSATMDSYRIMNHYLLHEVAMVPGK